MPFMSHRPHVLKDAFGHVGLRRHQPQTRQFHMPETAENGDQASGGPWKTMDDEHTGVSPSLI